jgi:hypothetical protein
LGSKPLVPFQFPPDDIPENLRRKKYIFDAGQETFKEKVLLFDSIMCRCAQASCASPMFSLEYD